MPRRPPWPGLPLASPSAAPTGPHPPSLGLATAVPPRTTLPMSLLLSMAYRAPGPRWPGTPLLPACRTTFCPVARSPSRFPTTASHTTWATTTPRPSRTSRRPGAQTCLLLGAVRLSASAAERCCLTLRRSMSTSGCTIRLPVHLLRRAALLRCRGLPLHLQPPSPLPRQRRTLCSRMHAACAGPDTKRRGG